MKVGFDDTSFSFEFVRNLGFMYYGGVDLGEMMATAEKITVGDFESWFTQWDARARRTLSRAKTDLAAGHRVSARESFLRASSYFRMSEFYLHGDGKDPRILSASRASQKAYAEAARLTGSTWEAIEIPYEGTTLPGYFYKVDNSGTPRPTLIFHGGFDSSIEELYYYGGAPAVRRGYNCLTFDGPGQGAPIREQGLLFRHDWEAAVTPAVDYALTRPDVDGDKLALMGMSLGGYLGARAAAFEHRFQAAVFFDGVYDNYEAMRKLMPKEAIAAFDAGDVAGGEAIVHERMKTDTSLRWCITQGNWSYGSTGPAEFLEMNKAYVMEDVAGQIACPCLVMEAEGDIFFEGQPQRLYDALRVPKKLVRFTAEDGAENHCQSGALAYKDEVVFNWLDETMQLNGGAKA